MRVIDKYVKVFSMDMEQMPVRPVDAYEQGFKDAIEWAAKHALISEETDDGTFEHSGGYIREENYVKISKESILRALS